MRFHVILMFDPSKHKEIDDTQSSPQHQSDISVGCLDEARMKRPWYSLGYLSHGTLSGGSVLVGGAGRTSIFEGSLLGR